MRRAADFVLLLSCNWWPRLVRPDLSSSRRVLGSTSISSSSLPLHLPPCLYYVNLSFIDLADFPSQYFSFFSSFYGFNIFIFVRKIAAFCLENLINFKVTKEQNTFTSGLGFFFPAVIGLQNFRTDTNNLYLKY